MMMDEQIVEHIRRQAVWDQLPSDLRKRMGQSKAAWHRLVVSYSMENQLRWKDSLVRTILTDERAYYVKLVHQNQMGLMVYPYHLSDVIVKGLRITPFAYYVDIMERVMMSGQSYDAIPNFTAGDAQRILGIGRNQFIDIVNEMRAKPSSWPWQQKSPLSSLLPSSPVPMRIQHWWRMCLGFVSSDIVQQLSELEHATIDMLIDCRSVVCGKVDSHVVQSLYERGLVYLEVPVHDDDQIVVLPLDGFVMNRTQGDYFERLLYKIFVTMDERVTVLTLAQLLEIPVELVKRAISLYIRLGFAEKKTAPKLNAIDPSSPSSASHRWHSSWFEHDLGQTPLAVTTLPSRTNVSVAHGDGANVDGDGDDDDAAASSSRTASSSARRRVARGGHKRVGLLFDQTLTAFLMMGNLAPGLKAHAVTLFEVGKLGEEQMDDFVAQLETVTSFGEGEARRYYEHAITLRQTLQYLRDFILPDADLPDCDGGLNLIRTESLGEIDVATRNRILSKTYAAMISMSPMNTENGLISTVCPPHFGCPVWEVTSAWFQLYVAHLCGAHALPCVLFPRGTYCTSLPDRFGAFTHVRLCAWDNVTSFTLCTTANVIAVINDYAMASPVFVQAYAEHAEVVHIPFPFGGEGADEASVEANGKQEGQQPSHEHGDNDDAHVDDEDVVGDTSNGSKRATSTDEGVISVTEEDVGVDADAVVFANPSHLPASASTQPMDDARRSIHALPVVQALAKKLQLQSSIGYFECVRIGTASSARDSHWYVTNVHFGLPLFDQALNLCILRQMQRKALLCEANLDAHLAAMRSLTLSLLDFVAAECRCTEVTQFYANGDDASSSSASVEQRSHGQGMYGSLPYPDHAVYWNGNRLLIGEDVDAASERSVMSIIH